MVIRVFTFNFLSLKLLVFGAGFNYWDDMKKLQWISDRAEWKWGRGSGLFKASPPCSALPCSPGWQRLALTWPGAPRLSFLPQWQRASRWNTHHNFTTQTKKRSIWRADPQLMSTSDCRHWGEAAPVQRDGSKSWEMAQLSFCDCCARSHVQAACWLFGLSLTPFLEHFSLAPHYYSEIYHRTQPDTAQLMPQLNKVTQSWHHPDKKSPLCSQSSDR